jgi:hypothetical protein
MSCSPCAAALRGRLGTLGRAATFAIFVFSVSLAALPAQGQKLVMSYDDLWSYDGEVGPIPPDARPCLDIPCERVCNHDYCAHGTGRYSTDGGEDYEGGFRHGLMHGSGEYSSDFAHYVGGFADGTFDGEGILDCLGLPTFKGHFTAGFMDGRFEVLGGSHQRVEVFAHIWVGPAPPRGAVGYDKGRDYASTPCR